MTKEDFVDIFNPPFTLCSDVVVFDREAELYRHARGYDFKAWRDARANMRGESGRPLFIDLIKYWAFVFFHYGPSLPGVIGYTGHRKCYDLAMRMREIMPENVAARIPSYEEFKAIIRYYEEIGQEASAEKKWFFRNCWMIGFNELHRDTSSRMVANVLELSEQLQSQEGFDIDDFGQGLFRDTLEDPDLCQGVEDAILRSDGLGHCHIVEAMSRYGEARGSAPYKHGYWCYNERRHGIDLVFRVNPNAASTVNCLGLSLGSEREIIRASVVGGFCTFRLEDILGDRKSPVNQILAVESRDRCFKVCRDELEELNSGFKEVWKIFEHGIDAVACFENSVTTFRHRLINRHDADFQCARLLSGVWVVGSQVSGSDILWGYHASQGGCVMAAYIDLQPTRSPLPFIFNGQKMFQYQSSRHDCSYTGLVRGVTLTVNGRRGYWRAFTGDQSVQKYSWGDPDGSPVLPPVSHDCVMRNGCIVYLPDVLLSAVKEGRRAQGTNWVYEPKEQKREEAAITGMRMGCLEVNGQDKCIEIAVECPVTSDVFWLENCGIAEDANKAFDCYEQTEPYKLCVVAVRQLSEAAHSAQTVVECSYSDRAKNEKIDLSDASLVLEGRSWYDFHDTVEYYGTEYVVQKFPIKSLLSNRSPRPYAVEKDTLEVAGKVRITVENKPKEVLISKRGDEIGVYIPEGTEGKSLLFVSDEWVCVPGEMSELDKLCRMVDLASLCGSRDGWHSIISYLNEIQTNGDVYACVLPTQLAVHWMGDMALCKTLEIVGTLNWEKVKTGNGEVFFDDASIVETKLKMVGAMPSGFAFLSVKSAFLNRDLSKASFHSCWCNVGLEGARDLLEKALAKGINFLSLESANGGGPGWYRKTWLAESFADLCLAQVPSLNLGTLDSFEDPEKEIARLKPRQYDKKALLEARRAALASVDEIVRVLQGGDQVLSASMAAFLVDAGRLEWRDRFGSAWPRTDENQNDFQERTKSWRRSGVLPLKLLSRDVARMVLGARIWPLAGNGRTGYTTRNDLRNCFFGGLRVSDVCGGPLSFRLGSGDDCRCLAKDAKKAIDSFADLVLRDSCVTGVVSGMLEHVLSDLDDADIGQEIQNAELLFVAVLISRLTAFLGERGALVSQETQNKVDEIITRSFPRTGATSHEQRAWKLVMFYTTAVDMLVWFGSKVDGN